MLVSAVVRNCSDVVKKPTYPAVAKTEGKQVSLWTFFFSLLSRNPFIQTQLFIQILGLATDGKRTKEQFPEQEIRSNTD